MKAPNTRIVQAENQPDELPEKPLAPAGSGPHDPGMEARMVAVETGLRNVEGRLSVLEVKVDMLDSRMTSLEGKVDGLDTRLRSVETAIAAVAGKLDVLVDKIPSWWQPPVSAAGLLALLMAGIAAAHYLKILS